MAKGSGILGFLTNQTTVYYYDAEEDKLYSTPINGTATDRVEVTDARTIDDLRDVYKSEINNLKAAQNSKDPNKKEPENPDDIKVNSIQFAEFSEVNIRDESNLLIAPQGAKYPLKMPGDLDRIIFTAARLNLNSGIIRGDSNVNILNSNNTNNFNRRQFISTGDGRVSIGVQSPIMDQNGVSWGERRVDPMQGILFNAAMGALTNTESFDVGGALQEGFSNLIKNIGGAANDMFKNGTYKSLFAALAANNISLFSRATSLALNPNLELVFESPQLRPFNFSFMMAARSPKEAAEIKTIIKYFKYHMAVKVPKTVGLFLKSPHVFFIDYKSYNRDHDGINLIAPRRGNSGQKACALQNFSVDYTPLGSYMTYDDPPDFRDNPEFDEDNDGEDETPRIPRRIRIKDRSNSMVAYRLNLQFQEIVPVYDVDYTTEHPIGY